MANLIEGDTKVTGNLFIGNATAPPDFSGGAGAMTTTNRVNSALHLRTDADTLPEVLHNSAVAKLGLSGNALECRMSTLTANTANTYTAYNPRKNKITGVRIRFLVKPTSAAGTVVVGITIGGVQILASASENLEGLSDDTLTAFNLTATSADLLHATGEKIVITMTSNNADMTGGTSPIVLIDYDDN